jgi:succinate-semialdehyde dehydrogenase/glutarate-semialdehyde dehydrogenase
LITPQAVERSHQLVQAAITDGARLVWQSSQLPEPSRFFPPTLLTHVNNQMAICQQELFAPVLTVQSFATDAEALAIANATDAGLAAYIYGQDERRNFRIASQLQAGMVGINATAISDVRVPFGGVHASGFGREGSVYGLAEYQQIKHLCWQLD